jgi:hypothetical protein
MNSVIEVSRDYRLFTLNPLCPTCYKIIEWRKANPHIEIPHRNSLLIRATQMEQVLLHMTHLEIVWRTKKEGGAILK